MIDEKIIAAIAGERHKYYDFMCEMADWSRAMMTGEGQEEMLKEIRKGESRENIDQRVAVTVPRTPEVLSPAETIYRKTFRVDGIKEKYESPDKEVVQAVKDKVYNFFGNRSLYAYLQGQQLFYEFHDPNAWFVTEFESIVSEEGLLTDVKPYPLEITSHEAINYGYKYGVPEFAISLRSRVEENAKGHMVRLETYTAYIVGGSVVYREELSPQPDGYTFVGTDRKERFFTVKNHQNGIDFFPGSKFGAYRCGVLSDSTVKAPPYYSARHVLKRIVRGGSLKDVCKWKHVYPKLFGLDFDCAYEDDDLGDCNGNGYLGDNRSHQCPSCSGTGSMLHASELDNVRYKVSAGAMKDEIIPADAFYSYAEAPLASTQWISDDLMADQIQVALTMFNTNIEQKPVAPTTATAELLNWENVNNEVYTFALQTSHLAEIGVRSIAGYMEQSVSYNHSYPKNLGLTPLDVLTTQYNEAIDKGLMALAEAIFCEILGKQYSDDPAVVERHRALQMHNPERGRAYDRVFQIMQQRDPSDLDRVKFENWPRIATLVDVRFPNFGLMTFERQEQEIDKIAMSIAEKVKPMKDDFAAMVNLEEPDPINEPDFEEGEQAPQGVESTPEAPVVGGVFVALNGAQVTSLIGLVSSVAAKELPAASAIEIMESAYGYDRKKAQDILAGAGTTFVLEDENGPTANA